jgi:hypothetical protein
MRRFIEELRHRNVIRVGIAYIIAGWLIAQGVMRDNPAELNFARKRLADGFRRFSSAAAS